MAAPQKPWERSNLANNLRANSLPSSINSSTPPGRSYARQPPPPPPRPSRSPALNSRMSYGGGGYGGYGYGSSMGYGGYGGYSSMYGGGGGLYGSGMYGGMNRMGGYDGQGTNSFARLAEESSRPAFQSIESIVQAFGSVAMMLESTYGAVYNSFRAVLGVADNFSNLRAHFTQVFSAFAIVKTLRYLYRKLLVFLRLRDGGLEEDLWASAMDLGGSTDVPKPKKTKSSWPILLFLAVVFGGPYLIWKMLSSINPKEERNWANGEDDHFVALAEYDFDGDSEEELSFRTGQKIRIAPKDLQPRMRGWLLACVDGKKQGIIPANYIKLLGKRQGSKTLNQIAESSVPSDPASQMEANINRNESFPDVSTNLSRSESFPNMTTSDSYQELDNIFEGVPNQQREERHVHFENEENNMESSFCASTVENNADSKGPLDALEDKQETK